MYDVIKGKVVDPQEAYVIDRLCALRQQQEHCVIGNDCDECDLHNEFTQIVNSLSKEEQHALEYKLRTEEQERNTAKNYIQQCNASSAVFIGLVTIFVCVVCCSG